MANTILTYVYVSENGIRYRFGQDSEVAGQLDGGGASKTGAVLWDGVEAIDGLPGNMRPRRVRVYNAANGITRYIPCFTKTCSLYATPGTTITLEDSDGAALTFARQKPLAEEQRVRVKVA